jgi:hypothetical protein
MKLYSKDGIEMMDVKSIEKPADDLVIKGKMMGTMATVIHVKPEDLWAALNLLSWKTKLALPAMLLKGWKKAANKP